MSFVLPLELDSIWTEGHQAAHIAPSIDYFFVKAIALIGVVITIVWLVVSLNKFREGLTRSKKSDLREFLNDELVLNRHISFRRTITYYCVVIFLVAIPLFIIVHTGIALIITLFLLGTITLIVYFDVYVRYTKVTINRENRTVTLSSLIGKSIIKAERVKPFKELVFEKYNDNGFAKYALYIDHSKDTSFAIWDGFDQDEVKLILDWSCKTSLESFQFNQ